MGLSEDIKKINDELNKLRKELGKNPLKPFDEKDLERAKEALTGLRSEVREMSSDLDYVSKLRWSQERNFRLYKHISNGRHANLSRCVMKFLKRG